MANIPIAITGMHRSGTSMITRAMHDSGLHLIGSGARELVDAADDNPEGFWENKAIVACNEELLEAAGGAWDNPPDLLPQAVDDPRFTHIAESATAAIAALSGHDHWGFKDPRTCLTAAYWLDLVPELRFIICVRHPLEVALSLKGRNQSSYSLGLALWERYYRAALSAIPPDRRIVTHYDTHFLDPEGELGRLCAFAGLDAARVEGAPAHVRSDLRHHTIGVDLVNAGVNASLRALYTDLCIEAGASVGPDPSRDEGRVRRLILDGAVAARRAEQRQAAIDRLQEREAEFRARIDELERQLATVEAEHHRKQAEAVRAETVRALQTLDASVALLRSEVGTGPLHRAARALPLPVRQRIQGVRSAAGRSRSAGERIPPPAPVQLSRARHGLRRAATAPVPIAKAAARRLPPGTQEHLQRASRVVVRLRQRSATRVRARKAAAVPKGPVFRHWKHGYREMVTAIVPHGEPWLVVTAGSPKKVRDARTPPGSRFPDTHDGRPFADDLAHIAQLEALRFAGSGYLVVPEGSRPWFRRQTELRDHILRTYRTVVDDPGAGAVFDLAGMAVVGARSLRGEVGRLAAGVPQLPAVLDWTDIDVAPELTGLAIFRPPEGVRLPYLDNSVDIVVVDGAHDLDDARRVASLGVIQVAPGATGVVVERVEGSADSETPAVPRVLVWSAATESDEAWRAHLAARVAAAGAELRIGEIDAAGLSTFAPADHDVVIVVEPHVLPLPGVIEAAARFAVAHPDRAVAGKVLRADGRLEAAGGMVFVDRSVALIAGSSTDVCAPWHDYVRPVCWAPGLVAATTDLWGVVEGPTKLTGRSFLREWCAAVWARGGSVVYQPTVTAVRVTGDGSEPSLPLPVSAWQRVLDLRPARPRELNDGAWRDVLAHDDVEACRG